MIVSKMIKKICILLLIIVVLFPVDSLADDSGPWPDNGENISVSIKVYTEEIEIGGNIEFDITIRNKCRSTLDNIRIGKVFNISFQNTLILYKGSCTLKSGGKLTAHVISKIPYNIDWYKKKNNYYVDMNVEVYYDRIYDEDDYEDLYNKTRTIPIKITNLYDGSNYLDLKLIENDTVYYFRDNFSALVDDYISELDNVIIATNIYNNPIQDLLIMAKEKEAYSLYVDEFKHNTLKSNDSIKKEIEIRYYELEKRIPKTIPTYYKAIFKIEDKYYVTEIKKNYPTKILKCPLVDIYTRLSDPDDENSHLVTKVKNISSKNYSDIYFDYYAPNYNVYNEPMPINEDYIIKRFEKNQEITVPQIDNIENKNFIIGYLINDTIYSWEMYIGIDDYDDNKLKSYINEESTDVNKYIFLHQLTPSPTIEPTPLPTFTPTQTPAQTSTIMITSEPTQAIEVTNVAKESSMPLWVWVVLALTSICTGVIIWMFRQTNRKESE